MATAEIKASEEGINKLRSALEDQGENYKENLVKLTNLINDIVSGDIQGDPADNLVKKFVEKREMFNNIAQTIDEAEEYMGLKKTKFGDMLGNINSRYK